MTEMLDDPATIPPPQRQPRDRGHPRSKRASPHPAQALFWLELSVSHRREPGRVNNVVRRGVAGC
jgi:hypothetical protein